MECDDSKTLTDVAVNSGGQWVSGKDAKLLSECLPRVSSEGDAPFWLLSSLALFDEAKFS